MDWQQLIRLSTVNVIVGFKGKGKSALGYYLTEVIAPKHDLLPIIVNFPREKQALLPPSYVIKDLEDALTTERAMVLVDEGSTQLPAGTRMEEFVKGCSSLSRQRDQIIVFIFHATRDVGSRIMRGIDVVMVKEPGRRQIQQGSKDKEFRELLLTAKAAIKEARGDRRSWTYVDSEEPDYQGLMQNPLPSFWDEDLSKAWRGVSLRLHEQASRADTPFEFPPEEMEALFAIAKYETYYPLNDYLNGWACQDVKITEDIAALLVQQGILHEVTPARYRTTTLGGDIVLSLYQQHDGLHWEPP